MTVHRPQPVRTSVRTTGKPMFNVQHFLASLVAQEDWYCIHIVHQCCDQQLSKQGIRWPVSPDRIAGSGVDPSRSSIFLELSADKLLVFKWSQAQVWFFLIHMKYVLIYMCRTIKILISNGPRKLKFSQFLRAGMTCQLLWTFLTKVTRWSRSTSNFYALVGQNLTGAFSWSWQSFVSICDVFNCLSPLNVQNEILLLSRVFCHS